jgi:tetratricopeptide (TPR) repeat protein
LQWENIDAALLQFKRVLSLNPGNARALYYLGQVEMNSGQLTSAVKTLKAVEGRFPDSVAIHRELGICYYLLNSEQLSSDEFKSIQALQPDNLTAHFYLALLYRRMGQVSSAQKEARLYADEKSDPAAPTVALRYFQTGKDLYAESLSTHVYSYSEPANAMTAGLINEKDGRQPMPTSSVERRIRPKWPMGSLIEDQSSTDKGGSDR